MKILSVSIKNYRSIEDLSLNFNPFYTAISGRNDSGKSNVIKAIKAIFKPDELYFYHNQNEIIFKEHFPAWKMKNINNEDINISVEISISKEHDSGLYKFVEKFSGLDIQKESVLKLESSYNEKKRSQKNFVYVDDRKCEEYASQEIFKKIQSSRVIFTCNPTEPDGKFILRRQSAAFGAMSIQDKSKLDKQNTSINKTLTSLAKKHKKDIEDLFGRLTEEYDVGLSVPKFNLDSVPFEITLGDKLIDVPLDDWGSGTKNKTAILLAFLRAKQIKNSEDVSKITPIILIEEPESFLHPSAQATFGKLLQSLSEENKLQIISTTHSPYFLSQNEPSSNILLERKNEGKKIRETAIVTNSEDNWMEPYAISLGIINKEFEPWKKLIFNTSNKIIMVEGPIDLEYFTMLKDQKHGVNGLSQDVEIFSYGGKDHLKNTTLLKFIKERYKKLYVTFDLDAKNTVVPALESLGLKENTNFISVGNKDNGEDIEGLLPNSVKSQVNASNTQLISKLTSADKNIKHDAKLQLKKKYLQEFKDKSSIGNEFYGEFYKITKLINKAFK